MFPFPRAAMAVAFLLLFSARSYSSAETNRGATFDSAEAVAVPVPTAQAMRFYQSGNALWVVRTVWDLVLPAALLFSGLSTRVRSWSERRCGVKFFSLWLYLVVMISWWWVVDFPLTFYQTFVRPHDYGLSNQTLGDWFGDWTKLWAVTFLGMASVAWLPLYIIRKSPKFWWLICSVAAVPLVAAFLLVKPLWIDPLFDKFGPMQDKQLETKILALAERAGVEGSRVFEVDKSRETKAINAYVTGFLDSKRIVLWDTAIAKLDREELLTVVAHELGHYVLGHVVQIIVGASLAIFAGLYGVHLSAGRIIRRFGPRFGFERLEDAAALPLLAVLLQLIVLCLMPVILAVSRHNEHEADRFAIELTGNGHAAAMTFVRIQQENLSVPWHHPIFKLLRDTHPTIGERIEFFNRYEPARTNRMSRPG